MNSNGSNVLNTSLQVIAEKVLGPINWTNDMTGFFPCPGKERHTCPDAPQICAVFLDDVARISCFETGCRDILLKNILKLQTAISAEKSANQTL